MLDYCRATVSSFALVFCHGCTTRASRRTEVNGRAGWIQEQSCVKTLVRLPRTRARCLSRCGNRPKLPANWGPCCYTSLPSQCAGCEQSEDVAGCCSGGFISHCEIRVRGWTKREMASASTSPEISQHREGIAGQSATGVIERRDPPLTTAWCTITIGTKATPRVARPLRKGRRTTGT